MRDLYNYYVLGSEGSPQDLTGIWKWNGGEGSKAEAEKKVGIRNFTSRI